MKWYEVTFAYKVVGGEVEILVEAESPEKARKIGLDNAQMDGVDVDYDDVEFLFLKAKHIVPSDAWLKAHKKEK